MRILQHFPLETRRRALVILALFALVAIVGGVNLRGQTTSLCGNGVVNAPEECDDSVGNGNGPNCTILCTKVKCGDGIVTRQVGEECDLGSSASSQAACGRLCGETCKWAIISCASSSSKSLLLLTTPSSSSKGASSAVSSSSRPTSSFAQLSSVSMPTPVIISSTAALSSSRRSVSSVGPASVATSSVQAVVSSVSVAVVSSVPASSIPVATSSPVPVPSSSSVALEVASSSATSLVIDVPLPQSSSAVSSVQVVIVCGDGWIHPSEQCDDGNRTDADGCSPQCTRTIDVSPQCGDGKLNEQEQCDNGLANSNRLPDACRTNCRNAFCGDGVRDASEACDDGNVNERDGCTWKCEKSQCGNGEIESMEECDFGVHNSNVLPNACRTMCRKPWCGDGVMDTGEECDDANAVDDDRCSKTCIIRCPKGANNIQGTCVELVEEESVCGALCTVGKAWDSSVTWLFSFFL